MVTERSHDDFLVKYQPVFDIMIAFACFAISVELIYFSRKSSMFPYKLGLILLSASIGFCGAAHLVTPWTASPDSVGCFNFQFASFVAIAKMICAFLSCATAVILLKLIPDALNVKIREFFLKGKIEELDRQYGLVLTWEDASTRLEMLTKAIEEIIDSDAILKTAVVELGKTLGLEECALWTPSHNGLTLQLAYALKYGKPVGWTVPMNLPIVEEIYNSAQAMPIACTCPLAKPLVGRRKSTDDLPLAVSLSLWNWPDLPAKGRPIMILVLPADGVRKWRDFEVKLVEAFADEVAIAFSRAVTLEESRRACDRLMEQNAVLEVAQREEEMAIHSQNDFHSVMIHWMQTPICAIIALSSFLLETKLTPEERAMIETVLKSSNILSALINDFLDVSRLEDGSLDLEARKFNLHEAISEVVNLIKHITLVKKLSLTLRTSPDLPAYAVGDEKRLVQIILHLAGNAVKFTKEGYVAVTASVCHPPGFYNGHFYLRVQIKDSGCGILPQDIPLLFNKFSQPRSGSGQNKSDARLGLAICRRFASLMGGHIWIESEGIGKGTTAVVVVQLGLCKN